MSSSALNRREQWLLSRLADHGVICDTGDTDFAIRCGRARQGILREGLAPVVVCRGKSGKPLTYRDVFPGIYGEPLENFDVSTRPVRVPDPAAHDTPAALADGDEGSDEGPRDLFGAAGRDPGSARLARAHD